MLAYEPGRCRDHSALAAGERRQRLVLASLVGELALLRPVGEILDVLDLHRAVELEPRTQAAQAVLQRRERNVVPGAEAFELHPRLPAGGEAARGARCLELRGGLLDFGPGLRRIGRIEAGLLERIVVDVKHLRRAVERHRDQVAGSVRVVRRNRAEKAFGIERLLLLGHQLVDRLDRAFGGHHRRRADFEHLDDLRRVAGTIRGDRRGHRFVVLALVDRRDLELRLRGIELGGDLADDVIEFAGHRMPPLDFGDRLRLGRQRKKRGRDDGAYQLRITAIHFRFLRGRDPDPGPAPGILV